MLWQIGSDRWRAAGGGEMGRRPHGGATRQRWRSDVVEVHGGQGGARVTRAARPGDGSRRRAPSATGGAAARLDPGDSNKQQPGAPHQAAVGEVQEEGGAAAHGRRRRGRGDEATDEIETPRKVGPSSLLNHDGRHGSEGSTAHPTRALPRAEIDLPGAAQRRLRK